PELIENAETKEALDLLRTSAFTDGEMLAYEKYWLDVSTEKSALQRERAEGRAEGEKIGIEKGEKQTKISMARLMKTDGEPISKIIKYSGLTADEIQSL
ncbi:MAG: hypothetical protein IKR94_10300, partial [Bacteroidales bacterium]|nr:hypothetical protein [Bacteroidales bacterium]